MYICIYVYMYICIYIIYIEDFGVPDYDWRQRMDTILQVLSNIQFKLLSSKEDHILNILNVIKNSWPWESSFTNLKKQNNVRCNE